jgi:hypothetical protein
MISMGDSNPKFSAFDELFERSRTFDELFDAFVKRGREKMELGQEISQLRSEKRNEISALRKEISALKKENRELKGTLEDAVHESVLKGERARIGVLLEELYIQKLERDAEGHETVPGREWIF